MDSGQPADAWCSSTARALDIFNRRGSLLAVALGGVNSEAVASLPAYNSPKATAPAPYSSSYQYNDHNSSTTMTSCRLFQAVPVFDSFYHCRNAIV
ncbi:hypothetical protein WUBG_14340 [Wuchereria bancrofti]|uniref:Uncharacterized protein n=1 Tax=Wuchereria bancrofti TaxID=6293 RepID=J9ECJ2_WUCBA|nr:hypothetical protein WUBG_14340 [Wuchereria bancrofti]